MDLQSVIQIQTAAIDLNGAAVKKEFTFGTAKVGIRRASLAIRDASTAGATVELNKRVTAGSATGEVAQDTIVKPASDQSQKTLYADFGTDLVIIEPGQGFTFETTADPAEEVLCDAVVEFVVFPENLDNLDGAVESA